MTIKLDKVDKQLLKCVKEQSGEQVKNIIRTLDCRTASTLRGRLDALDAKGYIILDRESYRGQVRAHITHLGKEILAGRAKRPSQEA